MKDDGKGVKRIKERIEGQEWKNKEDKSHIDQQILKQIRTSWRLDYQIGYMLTS